MEQELINSPLVLANKLGYLVPNSPKNISLKIGAVLLVSFVFVIAFMQNFYIGRDEIFEMINNALLIAGLTQLLVKMALLIFNSDEMLNLIELQKNFWNIEKCTKKTKKRVNRVLSTTKTVQKVFLYSLCVIFLCAILMCMINGKLPWGTWRMIEYRKFYNIAVIPAYLLITVVGYSFVYCFDCMFLGLVYGTVIQFKILCDHLKRMNVEDIESDEQLDDFYSQLKVYVDHHKFLRSYTNLLHDYYSPAFLVGYLSSSPMICSLFYATFESPNLALKFHCGLICFTVILQFAFYCIPLSTLSHEITTVSTAIYSSNWHSKHYMKLKKATLLMIQQAQQEIRFTACGLVDMNPQTLVDVLKAAFSISTFLRTLGAQK